MTELSLTKEEEKELLEKARKTGDEVQTLINTTKRITAGQSAVPEPLRAAHNLLVNSPNINKLRFNSLEFYREQYLSSSQKDSKDSYAEEYNAEVLEIQKGLKQAPGYIETLKKEQAPFLVTKNASATATFGSIAIEKQLQELTKEVAQLKLEISLLKQQNSALEKELKPDMSEYVTKVMLQQVLEKLNEMTLKQQTNRDEILQNVTGILSSFIQGAVQPFENEINEQKKLIKDLEDRISSLEKQQKQPSQVKGESPFFAKKDGNPTSPEEIAKKRREQEEKERRERVADAMASLGISHPHYYKYK